MPNLAVKSSHLLTANPRNEDQGVCLPLGCVCATIYRHTTISDVVRYLLRPTGNEATTTRTSLGMRSGFRACLVTGWRDSACAIAGWHPGARHNVFCVYLPHSYTCRVHRPIGAGGCGLVPQPQKPAQGEYLDLDAEVVGMLIYLFILCVIPCWTAGTCSTKRPPWWVVGCLCVYGSYGVQCIVARYRRSERLSGIQVEACI